MLSFEMLLYAFVVFIEFLYFFNLYMYYLYSFSCGSVFSCFNTIIDCFSFGEKRRLND